MKILRWIKAIWRRVFPKAVPTADLGLVEKWATRDKGRPLQFRRYTPKTEAELLKRMSKVERFSPEYFDILRVEIKKAMDMISSKFQREERGGA